MTPLGLRIDEEISGRLPEISVFALQFADATLGVPSRRIEPMRDRVIAGARERLASLKDPRRLPAVGALVQAFPELARGTRRLWLDEVLRAIARNDPFPVQNDVVDAARLLSIHYGVPILPIDLDKARPPVGLAVAPPGTTARSPMGSLTDVSGLPVLVDAGGVLASPAVELGRASPGRTTRRFALIGCVPVRAGAPDVAEVATRAENWLSTLTGARRVSLESAAGT
jgi:DNA/RNA-binding domain of Phe-tRNA-synthetase-like protein